MHKVYIDKIYDALKKETSTYRVPVVDLMQMTTNDPYKVLVTTILSSRTNDTTTKKAAEQLFEFAPCPDKLEALCVERIAELIYPVGFYKNKAKFLKALPAVLRERFNSVIPQDLDLLMLLPGVGRKTANLVLAVAFNKPAICVDTHVHRITNRWGYVKTKTPLETEMELRKKLPQEYWTTFNSILVAFGQHTCTPISPHCDRCVINSLCAKVGVIPRKPKVLRMVGLKK